MSGNLAGILWDFFEPTKQRLKNIGEIFGAFFVRKFVAQTGYFVQNSLCKRATLKKAIFVTANFGPPPHHTNLLSPLSVLSKEGADLLNFGVLGPFSHIFLVKPTEIKGAQTMKCKL